MRYRYKVALFSSALALCVLAWQATPAHACDPGATTGAIVSPENGETALPETEFLILGQGALPDGGGDAELTDEHGTPYQLEAEVVERPGTFQWAVLYRNAEELSTGLFDFAMPFDAPEGTGTRVSFQVRDGDPAQIGQPHVNNWQAAIFEEPVQDECIGAYNSKVRIPFGGTAGGDPPLWYDVELVSEDGEDSTRRAVLPGAVEADQDGVVREVRPGFDVQCLRITAVGSNGERGEAFEDCQPQGCAGVDPELADSDTLWEEIEECDDEIEGEDAGIPDAGGSDDGASNDGSNDSACRVADGDGAPAWPAALVLVAFAARGLRSKKR